MFSVRGEKRTLDPEREEERDSHDIRDVLTCNCNNLEGFHMLESLPVKCSQAKKNECKHKS